MRVLILATAVCACTPYHVGQDAAPGSQANALAAEADNIILAWAPNYDLGSLETDDRFARAEELYARACDLGNYRACWRSKWRLDQVIEHCRAGDVTSCHVFADVSPTRRRYRDLPGAASRMYAYGARRAVSTEALQRECSLGLPRSCQLYAPHAPDRAAIDRRAYELALPGCRAGLIADCAVLDNVDIPHAGMIADQERCRWGGDCDLVARDWNAATPAAIREQRERGCQVMGLGLVCAELATAYIGGILPEPVPDRGATLLTWACPRVWDDLFPAMKDACRGKHPPPAPRQIAATVAVPSELATPATNPSAHALAAEADRAWLSWQPDYNQPQLRTDDTQDRAEQLYQRACLLGDHRACWRGVVRQPQVVANCRGGDIESCRELPYDWAMHLYRSLPGVAARTYYDGDKTSVLAVDLRRECKLGLPTSCRIYRELASDSADALLLDRRGLELAEAACRRGSRDQCDSLVYRNEPEVAELRSAETCRWSGDCTVAVEEARNRGDAVMERDLREKMCQLSSSADDCGKLARAYVDGVLPEPVPDRGRALLAWSCDRLEAQSDVYSDLGCPDVTRP